MATPNDATGRVTSAGTTGTNTGSTRLATIAMIGNAASPAIFATVSTKLTRLPERTPT